MTQMMALSMQYFKLYSCEIALWHIQLSSTIIQAAELSNFRFQSYAFNNM